MTVSNWDKKRNNGKFREVEILTLELFPKMHALLQGRGLYRISKSAIAPLYCTRLFGIQYIVTKRGLSKKAKGRFQDRKWNMAQRREKREIFHVSPNSYGGHIEVSFHVPFVQQRHSANWWHGLVTIVGGARFAIYGGCSFNVFGANPNHLI